MGGEHHHKLGGQELGENDNVIRLCATQMKEGFDKNLKLPRKVRS